MIDVPALLLWLFALLVHPAVDVGEPVPPPAVFASPAPAPPRPVVAPGDRPTTPHSAPPAPVEPAPADVEPSCEAGEEWQGEFGCVAPQLPEETTGRAID